MHGILRVGAVCFPVHKPLLSLKLHYSLIERFLYLNEKIFCVFDRSLYS